MIASLFVMEIVCIVQCGYFDYRGAFSNSNKHNEYLTSQIIIDKLGLVALLHAECMGSPVNVLLLLAKLTN